MKKNSIVLVICLSISSLILISCTKELNSKPPHLYELKIRFIDKQGNDIVHGIDIDENSTDPTIFKVKKNAYKLSVIQAGKEKEQLLFVQTADSYDCLIIYSYTPPDYRPFQLTHKLICPHIFGDEEEHTIVSNWKDLKIVGNFCTDIILDGKSYSVSDTDIHGFSIILVEIGE